MQNSDQKNLGKGLGTQIINHTKKNNPRIIVGHDYRSYSEEIKLALKKGLPVMQPEVLKNDKTVETLNRS